MCPDCAAYNPFLQVLLLMRKLVGRRPADASQQSPEDTMPRHATKLKLIAAVVSGAFLIGGLSACGRTQSTESLLT
jgi:hypothetical protein